MWDSECHIGVDTGNLAPARDRYIIYVNRWTHKGRLALYCPECMLIFGALGNV